MNLMDVINEATKDQTGTTVNDGLIQAAVDQIEIERKERVVRLLASTVSLYSDFLKEAVESLRRIREQEKTRTSMVKKIDRAFRYFHATGIPFPLFYAQNCYAKHGDRFTNDFCSQIGIPVPADDSPLWEVPSDFVAPEK